MAKGKYQSAGKFSAKSLIALAAMVLVLCSVVGGTVAWLIDSTTEVKNTFTYGDVNIKLDETEIGEDGEPATDEDGDPVRETEGNEYEMIPGEDIYKDPLVTVLTESESCWLFVKLVESDNFGEFFEDYTVEEGWTALTGVEGVYFRQVSAEEVAEEDAEFWVIKDNTLTVKETVTKEQLNELDAEGAENYPTLTVTAYAVQYAGFEPEITEGAEEPTAEQIQTAALSAWEAIEE